MVSAQSALTPTVVAFPADPILSAIAAHRQGWTTFANAAPETVTGAAIMQRAALANLLGTPCTTRAGADSLLRHLRACLAANGRTLDLGAIAAGLGMARASDLALTLDRERAASSAGAQPSSILRRINRVGRVVAGVFLIVGGAALIGFASIL